MLRSVRCLKELLKLSKSSTKITKKQVTLAPFMMSTKHGSDHLERTSNEERTNPEYSEAEVIELNDMSPTVKRLLLKVNDQSFIFKAGQWVDFYIHDPTVQIVGGYSISSEPFQFLYNRVLELAVKFSKYPPAFWTHTQCQIGNKVSLRVGGTQIIYDPQPSDPHYNVLLIAGGIGINPLLSMIRHANSLKRAQTHWFSPVRFQLLYSASTRKELIFQDDISEIVNNFPSVFQSTLFVTQEDVSSDNKYTQGRIQDSHLASAVQEFGSENLECYICGPPPMIEDMESSLLKLNMKPENVHYEKWW
ncbi:oxidoreductase NAD-binding domain-containing protein 1-like isoform X1 [Antedon mediterranea]|uniref:oxidoreductase NAD-binding domain-containing protein 1-like isoform X1 n=1 Tax=Antedon mediterranea TaxID=105859 RepID=UPI003AF6CB79